ncbi:MAG: uroporphyrinogen decarboxylase [Aliidongia sp.]|jgi:uroporphyrinogen decarboxylase|nr:uroporphyrinogen decarboxylase [Aliidongia sp.]
MKTEDKLLLRALRGVPVERHPFWLMRQAGRYLPEYRELRAQAGSFLSLCFNPDLATKVTLQPIHRYGMDAAILFSDILVVPLGLGQEVGFQEGEGPKLEPIRDASGLARLASSLDLAKLEPIYETVRRVRRELPPETALIGFAGAPWTVATYVVEGGSSREFSAVKSWAAADKPGFTKLIDRLTEATIAHLTAQVMAGAEIVQLFDSWAGALDGEAFHNWVIEPTKRIVTALKAVKPTLPIIGFPKGAGAKYLGYARETGVDVLGLDPDVPLTFARDVLQPVAALQGNLDPNLLMSGGLAMETRIREILSALGKGKFVFNLGHGILPTTPMSHVERLSEILRTTSARS